MTAQRAGCANNCRQLGLATFLYADDFQDRFPTHQDGPVLKGMLRKVRHLVKVED